MAETITNKYLTTDGLKRVVQNVKAEDVKVLTSAKEYAKEYTDALANGQVKTNTDAIGTVDTLATTNKTVVGAINEVLAAVGTGGTAATVTITTDTTTEGALKSYTIKQGDTVVGVIDIPKDMVVESGSVVENPEGQAEGTYIKLVFANVAEPAYIDVTKLVDIYTAETGATQVQITINNSTREIGATIVAGAVTATELADNAVITAKIADANVTLTKLSAEVQTSLGKADDAAAQTDLDDEVARATAAEAKALTDAKAYTDEKDTAATAAIEAVDAKADAIDARVEALEGVEYVAITNEEIDALFA